MEFIEKYYIRHALSSDNPVEEEAPTISEEENDTQIQNMNNFMHKHLSIMKIEERGTSFLIKKKLMLNFLFLDFD